MRTLPPEIRHDVADWIRAQIGQRCTRIKLLQRVKGGERAIGHWLLTPKVDPRALTDTILEAALREAKKLPDSSLYAALSYRAGRSIFIDRTLWRVALAAPGAPKKRTAARRARKREEPAPTRPPKPRAARTKRAATTRGAKPRAPRQRIKDKR
jgi:hypothetical protein